MKKQIFSLILAISVFLIGVYLVSFGFVKIRAQQPPLSNDAKAEAIGEFVKNVIGPEAGMFGEVVAEQLKAYFSDLTRRTCGYYLNFSRLAELFGDAYGKHYASQTSSYSSPKYGDLEGSGEGTLNELVASIMAKGKMREELENPDGGLRALLLAIIGNCDALKAASNLEELGEAWGDVLNELMPSQNDQ